MELPKNITQVGKWDQNCRIYVEDYVVSYMKQLNRFARNKEMAIAVYGTRKEEEDKSYLFLYGAGKLDLLQKASRHLSQAQKQEIERVRVKYFSEYQFLGYQVLNGELVEGFYICEQDICRYIEGYAQFYEKNDKMLAYMLDVRSEEPQPEVVDQEKYEEVKRRQEERRKESALEAEKRQDKREAALHRFHAEGKDKETGGKRPRSWKPAAAAAVFGVLCITGLSVAGNEEWRSSLAGMIKETVAGLSEQKLPDTVEVMGSNVQVDTLIAQDKLTQALQEENQAASQEESVWPEPEPEAEQESATEPESAEESEEEPEKESEQEESESAPAAERVRYTIKKGDTLTAISIRNYGDDGRVQEICRLNKITNPDDIKVGQKILLP